MVEEKEPCYRIWESTDHLAFLSIYPNMRGTTVVIPKKHYDSYAFALPPEELAALILAAQEVGLLLDRKLKVQRTALVLEGFGINHVHVKLFPLHGIPEGPWQPIRSHMVNQSNSTSYAGFISTHDGALASPEELSTLQSHLRE